MKETTLTTAYANALGDLLDNISTKAKVRWMDNGGVIREGELRSLVQGNMDFHMMPYGMDVRDASVWITFSGFETTETVEYLVDMIQRGGYMTI